MVVDLGEEYVFCVNLRVDGRAATMAVETRHWGHYWTCIANKTARWDDTDEEFDLEGETLHGLHRVVAERIAEQYAEVVLASRVEPSVWN